MQTLAGLHVQTDRMATAAALAQEAGAKNLLVFIKDDQTRAFVPAPGLSQTIAGGALWKQFFTRRQSEMRFDCLLPYVRGAQPEPVTAMVCGECVFAFFGNPQLSTLKPLQTLLPLLGALFRQEQKQLDANTRARLALESAAKSGELAAALSAARSALQRALLDADVISRAHAAQAAELRISEARLRGLMKKLEQSNRELEQFAYVAAHDLQEPLRTISSFSALLQARNADQLNESGAMFLGFILKGASRARQLIQDLLDFSRIGNSDVKPENFALQGALNDACAALAAAITDSDASIISIDLPEVQGDRAQLTQLFQNLISNAIKFRAEATPRIRIRATEEPTVWRVNVSDNGIGIRPEYYSRIFTIFQRLHTQEQYSGTGIGLAICKKIIDRHGGEIGVDSKTDAGSTFFFTLPKRGPGGFNDAVG